MKTRRKAVLFCILALASAPALAQLKLPAQKQAAPAKSQARAEYDPEVIKGIFGCLAPGLPKDWAKAWINVTSVGSYDTFLAEFFVATTLEDRRGKALDSACGPVEMGTHIRLLNQALTPAQKRWPKARITFMRDGKYEVHFDKP